MWKHDRINLLETGARYILFEKYIRVSTRKG